MPVLKLYGKILSCPVCKSSDLQTTGSTNIGEECSVVLDCLSCKHIWHKTWNRNAEVSKYNENKSRM